MSEVKLTEDQRQAVYNRGGSLLVSAAAGSGKTKVLVERLLERMNEENVNVDDFLIITFTRAAAAELRAKIASEITKRVAANPRDMHLRQQLYKIYQADIKTVDAFCVQVLRANLHLLVQNGPYALTPDFRVMDEQDALLLRTRAAELTLESFYENIDEQGEILAETLGAGRDDRSLETLMLDLYNKVQSHPYPMLWLDSVNAFWNNIPEELSDIAYGRILMDEAVSKAEYWANALEEEIMRMEGDEKLYKGYADRFAAAAASLRQYKTCSESGFDAVAAIDAVFPTLGRVMGDSAEKKRAKSIWDGSKAEAKNIKSMLSISTEDALKDLRMMAPAMQALIRLTKNFTLTYEQEKLRRNQIDFSDQEHLAIRLLLQPDGTPTDLAKQISQHYIEIMVDEYQDTNEVQNKIFAAISRDGKNLFTVGDLKQSIYRFRLADPTIFREKYKTFKMANDASEGEDRKVLLSMNFRSRKEVLESTNFIFRNVMSDELGDLQYGDSEALHFGASYYDEGTTNQTELHLIDLEKGEEDEESPDRLETEAKFTAQQIERLLKEGFPVRDSDGTMRPCEMKDFVILMRSPGKRIKAFTKALQERGIACGTNEDDAFFETMEIAVIFSFLQIIDNPHQDVPLISVLRSPLFGFTPDKLARIRAGSRETDFYEAMTRDEDVKTKEFLQILQTLRMKAGDMSCDELIWYLYAQLHVMAIFGAMEGGKTRKEHLTAFYTYAQDCAAKGKRSLFDFVTQVRRLIKNGKPPMFSTNQSSGGVQIMSIHKSKGLEFPIVLLCDVQKKFNKEDLYQPVLVHPELGLGTDCVDRERGIRYDTISRTAIQKKLEREGKSEELRLLYVAMTRAQEKLIIIDCRSKMKSKIQKLIPKASLPVSPEVCAQCSCMGDWLLLPLLCTQQTYAVRRWAEMENENEGPGTDSIQLKLWENPTFEKEETEDIVITEMKKTVFHPELLERSYAWNDVVNIPQKTTATQLKGRYMDDEISEGLQKKKMPGSFARPKFLEEHHKLSASEKGTACHKALQYLKMGQIVSEAELNENIRLLKEKRILSEAEAASLERTKLMAFYQSETYERICKAEHVWREYQFSILAPASLIREDIRDEEILLQGVVDLFFEENGELCVLDFKTDHIRPGEEAVRASEYQVQLEIYSAALKRIMKKKVKEKMIFFVNTGATYQLM